MRQIGPEPVVPVDQLTESFGLGDGELVIPSAAVARQVHVLRLLGLVVLLSLIHI